MPTIAQARSRALAAVSIWAFACSVVSAQTSSQPAPQPQSSSSSITVQPKFWSNPDPNAQVTVLENTLLHVRTNDAISTRQTREGAALLFTLSDDVVVDDTLIVPRGATVHGTVVSSKQPGALTGSAELILQLTSLEFGGRSYPLYTYQFKVVSTSKTQPTETKIKTGSAVGAVAGFVLNGSANGQTSAVGKLAGMGTGAAIGAGIGTVVAAATPGPVISIPAESQLDFTLASPISVVPASEKEAKRLAEGLHAGGPVLYVRGETP
jgi:hypothetical protein